MAGQFLFLIALSDSIIVADFIGVADSIVVAGLIFDNVRHCVTESPILFSQKVSY